FLTFCFPDTAITVFYTLSLHDALPILLLPSRIRFPVSGSISTFELAGTCLIQQTIFISIINLSQIHKTYLVIYFFLHANQNHDLDRKSTRLNSSHVKISYAVFCLKKKK